VSELPDVDLYEGIHVDIAFGDPQPRFGDLFLICGDSHPRFPPTASFGFERLADLRFEQVDDYFGVRSESGAGDDVEVWLFPLVDGEVVEHYDGPLDGVRLSYNVLRNPAAKSAHFMRCVQEFATVGSSVNYRGQRLTTEPQLDLSPVRRDIEAIIQHWASQDIVVGSDESLEIDF
jgi:hypothetical protein